MPRRPPVSRYLVNMSEDPLLSGVAVYPLEVGTCVREAATERMSKNMMLCKYIRFVFECALVTVALTRTT